MVATQNARLHVLQAFLCREPPNFRPGSSDFIGVYDFAELPESGPLLLTGSLVLKICRALVITPTSVGVHVDPLSLEMTVRLMGPKGQVAVPHRRKLTFDPKTPALARHTIELAGLAVHDVGMYAFEISVAGDVLTAVPLLVGPHGTLKNLAATLGN